MKKIKTHKGEEISTPWLGIDEAALYCGMSRSHFVKVAANVPHSFIGKRYHIKVLDEWMKKGSIMPSPTMSTPTGLGE